MPFFKISLIRSGTGLSYKQRAVLQTLGLKKRYKPVFHPVDSNVAGMIMMVKELVAVKEVESSEKKSKKSDPGFYVEMPISPIGPSDAVSPDAK